MINEQNGIQSAWRENIMLLLAYKRRWLVMITMTMDDLLARHESGGAKCRYHSFLKSTLEILIIYQIKNLSCLCV